MGLKNLVKICDYLKACKMWWRVVVFCVLVTFILYVVLSSIHGRPVTHFFFHRCCEDNIENDKIIFEDFGGNTNLVQERLVGEELLFNDNSSFVSDEDVKDIIKDIENELIGNEIKLIDNSSFVSDRADQDVIKDMNEFNVHDPKSRLNWTFIELTDKIHKQQDDQEESGEFTTIKTKDLILRSERLIIDKEIEEKDSSYDKYKKYKRYKRNDNYKITKPSDAVKKLETALSKNIKPSEFFKKLDVIVSANPNGYSTIDSHNVQSKNVTGVRSKGDLPNTVVTSTEISGILVTSTESETTARPEIKMAPPLDEMIVSDMHENNDSGDI